VRAVTASVRPTTLLKNIGFPTSPSSSGGNTGRNTTIIRSNYLWEESETIYEVSVKLWETLSDELNYNVMYSPRGVMMLAHTVHDIQVFKRHVHANRLAGIDNEWLTPEQAKAFCPLLNISSNMRYPVLGAALQRRGGTARHDAVAWTHVPPVHSASTSSRTARLPGSGATVPVRSRPSRQRVAS
jgi:sarcosine oxidase, subunit beta